MILETVRAQQQDLPQNSKRQARAANVAAVASASFAEARALLFAVAHAAVMIVFSAVVRSKHA